MPLEAPNLDDRTYSDIVQEALTRIPHYIDGWNPATPSDPGMTLVELFAWMTDIIIYRQNQMPDWLMVKMMELIGMTLRAPTAARTAVTFELAAPLRGADTFTIPPDTEVATTQTETQLSVVFATERPLAISAPQLQRLVLLHHNEERAITELDITEAQHQLQRFTIFSQSPKENDAACFGFRNDMSHHLLQIFFECGKGADNWNVTRPPLVWECATLDQDEQIKWQPCVLGQDETSGLVLSGNMNVHVTQMQQTSPFDDDEKLYWLRLRYEPALVPPTEKKPTGSPHISQVAISSLGGTTTAVHAEVIRDEFLGYSDGTPGQRFYLQATPLLPPDPSRNEHLIVRASTGQESIWQHTDSFSDLPPRKPGMNDEAYRTLLTRANIADRRLFTLNLVSGELHLPPTQTDPHGFVSRYGAIPPRDAMLWFRQYRYGGGAEGNVAPYALDTLKTAVPGINRVYNLVSAKNGQDQETMAAAKMRAPHEMHSRNRAVTATDFEHLAKQAGVALARAKCLQHEPDWVDEVGAGDVHVYVLPVIHEPEKQLTPSMLMMPTAHKRQIKAFLDERRLLTVRLLVAEPQIVWIQVRVTCRLTPGAEREKIEAEIATRLYHYLNPLVGGADENGWPFGRDLYTYDVYTCLQGIPDVLAVPDITLYKSEPNGRKEMTKGVVPVSARSVIALEQYEFVVQPYAGGG